MNNWNLFDHCYLKFIFFWIAYFRQLFKNVKWTHFYIGRYFIIEEQANCGISGQGHVKDPKDVFKVLLCIIIIKIQKPDANGQNYYLNHRD